MELQRQVGEALKRRRKHRGMSQAALAEASGRSLQMIGNIESGRSAPSFETLEALGRALGVPAWELFIAPAAPDETTNRIMRLLSQLRPADRQRAEKVLIAMFDPAEPPAV